MIRFDNRDVGLSTKIDAPTSTSVRCSPRRSRASAARRRTCCRTWPPTPSALLDHLGIDRAHIVGASMGGMIVQTMAIEHPERVLSLTSIMSTTGDRDVGKPTPEAAAVLVAPPADEPRRVHRRLPSSDGRS